VSNAAPTVPQRLGRTTIAARTSGESVRHEKEPTMAVTFDALRYKQTTREQWQHAAEPWHRWGPTIEQWLATATEQMLDLAGVEAGSHVLDVAAGAGGQTVRAGLRAGPDGRVLATDISPAILAYAEQAARAAGVANVATREMDAEALEVADGTYDAVISRLGLIYLPDRQRALAGMFRALAPGGRIATVNYTTPDRNEFFSIPVSVIRRRAGLPAPAPGQPGPFSLGAPGAVESAYEEAGFEDIEVRRVDAPLRVPTAAECVRFEQESFGALHQMLAGLDEAEGTAAWSEIEVALARFEGPDGFAGPCELVVAAGTKR
jgi:SAM-dependent methyltransferase